MGMKPKKVRHIETFVEFIDPANARLVNSLMTREGMTFAQAVDYAELRKDYHWRIVSSEERGL